MYKFPLVTIDLPKLVHNTKIISTLCKMRNIEITVITKLICGDFEIVKALSENGIKKIGDSRIDNLVKLNSLSVEKWLIRPPMLNEISEVVEYADLSFNTELSVIKQLNEEAARRGKVHNIIIMQELGDIREGVWDQRELKLIIESVLLMKNIKLVGMGTSLSCFSYVKYDISKLEYLLNLVMAYESQYSINLPIITCGNSASIRLMEDTKLNVRLNNFRLGESVFLGKERQNYTYISNTYSDVFLLYAQVIEIKDKPSAPWGEVNTDSYGKMHSFDDLGIRKRAICALGEQDIDVRAITPCEDKIKIIGANSDQLVIDITDLDKKLFVGDIVEFQMGYAAILRAFTSNYVSKIYLTK